MRCLAIARRDWRGDTTMAADADYKELESNLTFLGNSYLLCVQYVDFSLLYLLTCH